MIPSARRLTVMALAAVSITLAGCANPGPPKPPSLNVPAVVTDLKATRYGDTVDVQFTLPERTSDGMLLRTGRVSARLCRATEAGICEPLPSVASFAVPGLPKTLSSMKDTLPAALTSGPARLLTYRVELRNANGKSAGYSDSAYTAAGTAPLPIADFRAEGSRLGVLLRWQGADPDAKVLVFREDLNQKPAHEDVVHSALPPLSKKSKFDVGQTHSPRVQPALVTLDASVDTSASSSPTRDISLDTTATPDTPYRYTPERRRSLILDGHKVEIWSEVSPAITFTLRDMFPPPAPTGLSVAGFAEASAQGERARYAVDLIWEPVQDEQLAGYKVYREEISTSASAIEKLLLTPKPVALPSLHDTTASGSKRYRYSVTSVDLKGNESEAVIVVLEPQSP